MVYNDIEKSNLTFNYMDLQFYFSSNFYLEKFKKDFVEYVNTETIKLCVKFGCVIIPDEMLLINLYRKIEKRGYKVYYKGERLNKDVYFNLTFEDKSFKR